MRYAVVGDDERTEATPRARGACPACNGGVRAKCGPIVTPHWAHLAADCDEWAESDTPWHRDWQACAPPARREVTMGRHRADVLTPGGLVVELQHSTISGEDIAAREAFYRRMIWIFDARRAVADDRLNLRVKVGAAPNYRSFRWKHPRKTVALCQRPVFLDLGAGKVLHLRRIYPGAPCGGWGTLGTAAQLREWIAGDYLDEWLEHEFERIAPTLGEVANHG